MADSDRLLIVGLGNPGRKYKNNRHNLGFQCVEILAERHNLKFSKQQNNAMLADGRLLGKPVLIAKPMTFMNNSGGPLKGLLSFYKLPLENLIVVFDELDLPLGTLRARANGGHGGQNGMRDIIQQLGTGDFARLRVGVGRPPGNMDPIKHLLKDFGKSEQADVEDVRQRAADALETWVRDGITLMMSRHNGPGDAGDPEP